MLLKKLMGMIIKFYERKLELVIRRGKTPRHIMVVTESRFLDRLDEFLEWCRRFKISEVTVCIREGERSVVSRSLDGLSLNIVTGYSGKDEIVDAVRELARLVKEGCLNVEDVNEDTFEMFLKIRSSPDLIVNVGDEIPEFLIWQSIYSELYFADISRFRYVDFLRCLRDYQRRERRYGR